MTYFYRVGGGAPSAPPWIRYWAKPIYIEVIWFWSRRWLRQSLSCAHWNLLSVVTSFVRTRSLLQGRFWVHKGFSSKGKAAFNQAHNINQVNCAITCGSAFRNGCYSRFGSNKRSISSMAPIPKSVVFLRHSLPILSWFDPQKRRCTSNGKRKCFWVKGIFLVGWTIINNRTDYFWHRWKWNNIFTCSELFLKFTAVI